MIAVAAKMAGGVFGDENGFGDEFRVQVLENGGKSIWREKVAKMGSTHQSDRPAALHPPSTHHHHHTGHRTPQTMMAEALL